MDFLQILKDYGWGVAIIFYLLSQYKDFFKTLVANFVPSWAEKQKLNKHRRELELERLKQERLTQETDRVDTITIQRDMLLAMRAELDEEKRERRDVQQVLYEFIGKYERFAAQNIEVMRDLSDLVRTDLDRVRELTNFVEIVVDRLREMNGRDRRDQEES